MPIITLTSDYGLSDPYLPVVKGRLLNSKGVSTLVDVTHNIEPGNVLQTAFTLRHSFHYFPKGTIHLILVDELSTREKWLAARIEGHYFVCADNGILSLLRDDSPPEAVVELGAVDKDEALFPGKGIMARAAAALSAGAPLQEVGKPAEEWLEMSVQKPLPRGDGKLLSGIVVYIDNAGNLHTNITEALFEEYRQERNFEIALPLFSRKLPLIHRHYRDAGNGTVIALFNSLGLLEIAIAAGKDQVHNGACSLLGIGVNGEVNIYFK